MSFRQRLLLALALRSVELPWFVLTSAASSPSAALLCVVGLSLHVLRACSGRLGRMPVAAVQRRLPRRQYTPCPPASCWRCCVVVVVILLPLLLLTCKQRLITLKSAVLAYSPRTTLATRPRLFLKQLSTKPPTRSQSVHAHHVL